MPLEERTAIANRESADLFLSIHANASRNTAAHGIETYFLSFASTPDAEAVAARENSASERAMHNLPDIIKAIALNNKLDESRDLAAMVQESMVDAAAQARTKRSATSASRRRRSWSLIGAGMPSVLAEISFLTNRQEAQLLKTRGLQGSGSPRRCTTRCSSTAARSSGSRPSRIDPAERYSLEEVVLAAARFDRR